MANYEELGRFRVRAEYVKCPKCDFAAYTHRGHRQQGENTIRRIQTLLKRYWPMSRNLYLTIDETAEATGLLKTYLEGIGGCLFFFMEVCGERMFLKKSVDTFLKDRYSGWFRLLPAGVEE